MTKPAQVSPISDCTVRVLILTPRLDTIGGVENYYNALQLDRDDPRIDYFFVTGPGEESLSQLGTRLLRNYVRFWNVLSDRRYRLVIINPTLDIRSFYRDALFCWIAHARGRRVLVFFRGWNTSLERNIRDRFLLRQLFTRTFARCRHFVVLGRVFANKLRALGCSTDSHFWIESTVADSTHLANFSIESRRCDVERLRLLFLARVTRTKGPWQALQALQIARQRRPDLDLELVIAGPGPELPRLRAYIESQKIDNVILAGPVRDAAKASLLASSHVLLHPTAADEGLPNAILEAMLYGMPVLTTAVGAIPEVVVHLVNGFVAESPDPEIFAGWIIQVATNRELRRRIALANHEVALRTYTNQAVRARFRAIIDACLAEEEREAALAHIEESGPTR